MPDRHAILSGARLPNAELVVFGNSAHMMFAEEQDRFLAVVRQFLDRITS